MQSPIAESMEYFFNHWEEQQALPFFQTDTRSKQDTIPNKLIKIPKLKPIKPDETFPDVIGSPIKYDEIRYLGENLPDIQVLESPVASSHHHWPTSIQQPLQNDLPSPSVHRSHEHNTEFELDSWQIPHPATDFAHRPIGALPQLTTSIHKETLRDDRPITSQEIGNEQNSDPTEIFSCTECNKTCSNPWNMIIHRLKHDFQLKRCRLCNYIFSDISEYYEHVFQSCPQKPEIRNASTQTGIP